MSRRPKPETVARQLHVSIGLLTRRLRQTTAPGDLTLPETSALSRLDRGGANTSSSLAKLEQISPQSMGATLGALETRGLIQREADPHDGRRIVLTITDEGRRLLEERRSARAEQLAIALSHGFTDAELLQLQATAPLLERLAQCL